MRNVSQGYLKAVNHYLRDIRTRVYFNDSAEPFESDLISVSVNEKGISEATLTIGDLCTNMCEISFIMPANKIPLQGGKVRIEHGIERSLEIAGESSALGTAKLGTMNLGGVILEDGFEWVSMGTYYITEIEKIDGTDFVNIVGYDSSTRLEKTYKPTITYPATIEAIANDILTQCNLTSVETVYPEITLDSYVDNCEEMLCNIAGLMGKSLKVNRDDKIEFYWWKDSGITIDRSIQYQNGYRRNTDDDVVITALTSGTEDAHISVGTGYGITFTNQYMTEEILTNILADMNGFTYTPCTIEYRGNPALEVGDIVTVIDIDGNEKKALISDHTLLLTGMKGDVESIGDTEENLVLAKASTEKKLEQLRNTLQNALKDITEKIVGIKGGNYLIDYDEDGFPCGWTIMNTPTLTSNTKLWKMTMGGFGFSSDGGKTFSNLAFDMDGNFYANAVNTGVLNGECFSLDLDNGIILIGNRDENGAISNPAFSFDAINGLRIGATETKEIFKGETAPTDTNKLWLDTSVTPNVMKFFDGNEWTIVNDQSQAIEEAKKSAVEFTKTTQATLESAIDGKVSQETLVEYIRFDGANIEIGTSSSGFKTVITNEELAFYEGSNKIAYISNNNLHINNAVIVDAIGIGRFKWDDEYDASTGEDLGFSLIKM